MQEDFRIKSSGLVDLGPLPEVVESDSETTWNMFVQLQAQQTACFSKTAPGTLAFLGDELVSADEVMAVARRLNRICPREPQWSQLVGLLVRAGAGEPPEALTGAQFRRTPALAKRSRVRAQIEWAAQHGLLHEVHGFLSALPEDLWVHFGE